MGRIDWKWWLTLVIPVIGLIIQFAVTPIFGMREQENNVDTKLWMSSEDIPPSHLVYTVGGDGELQSEYTPSSLYTLCAEQELVFLNPIVWSPSRTYYPPHEGCELTRVAHSENITYQEVDSTAVILSSTARYFSKEKSSIELMWVYSDFIAEKVSLWSEMEGDIVRVKVSNKYDYPVQYLCLVRLPPLMVNTSYTIEDSPPPLWAPSSVEIQTENSSEGQHEVDLPVIVEIDKYTLVTFDIEIFEQPPKISLVTPPGTFPPPPLVPPSITPSWIWAIFIIGAILVIAVIVLIVTRRRVP